MSKWVFAVADTFFAAPNGPRLLIYHHVGTNTGRQMEVALSDFRRQIDVLEADYQVVDLESALRSWNDADSSRLAVLTFDDGYSDTYTTAFPLLQEKGMPFTLYVSTRQVELAGEGAVDSKSPAMTWDEISAMYSTGLLTVGAHTHSHRDLREAGRDEVMEEVSISNALILKELGIHVRHFAYPWGYWSSTAHDVISERYESAVLGGSPNRQRPFDPYRVSRYPVQLSDESRFFRARLTGGLLFEERLRRRVHGYRGP